MLPIFTGIALIVLVAGSALSAERETDKDMIILQLRQALAEATLENLWMRREKVQAEYEKIQREIEEKKKEAKK